MKNTNKIINLLTAFTAVIGLCAASLVCFVVVYTSLNGSFPQKTPPGSSQITQAGTPTIDNIISPEFAQVTENETAKTNNVEMSIDSFSQNTPFETVQSGVNASQSEDPVIPNAYENGNDSLMYSIPIEQDNSGTNYIADNAVPATNNQNPPENSVNAYDSQIEQQNIENSTLVWIDDTAKRYHKKDGCGMDNAYQVTLEEALQKGKTPCGNCYK